MRAPFFLLSEALLIEAQKRGHKYKSSTSCSLGRQRMTWSNGKTCWPNRHTDKKFDKGKSTTFFYTIWVDDNKNYDIKKFSWCHTTKKVISKTCTIWRWIFLMSITHFLLIYSFFYSLLCRLTRQIIKFFYVSKIKTWPKMNLNL